MPTLAPKLPYTHAFAGGYPRRGGQPLPSDADAIDYLERVAAADGGAAVEVGVAVAVDAFIKGCKADGIWDAIKASCLLCGPRTLSGALVGLKSGTNPTNVGDSFVSDDYNRVTGLKGDGATTYLDSGRANDADGQDDKHIAFYAVADSASGYMGSVIRSPSVVPTQLYAGTEVVRGFVNNATDTSRTYTGGFAGTQRIDSTTVELRSNGVTIDSTGLASVSGNNLNTFVFARNDVGTANAITDARLAFYSIGSSLDLSALDTHVSRYVSAVQFWSNTGLAATGYDDATIDYINRAYSNGGTL